jgi:hypothetical protein
MVARETANRSSPIVVFLEVEGAASCGCRATIHTHTYFLLPVSVSSVVDDMNHAAIAALIVVSSLWNGRPFAFYDLVIFLVGHITHQCAVPAG